ncbi:hypothetical protein, partial [Mycobacteroides abscessus]|uniref:hypothetical protein n=1 Tax=Mycobacteroides abscessus TaxID=36809 RepID=UPI001A992DBB
PPSGSAAGVRHQQHRRRPALLGGATRVGNFDERQWGISVSAINDDLDVVAVEDPARFAGSAYGPGNAMSFEKR